MLSLRKEVGILPRVSYPFNKDRSRQGGRPPKFWDSDMDKWKQKFEECNRSVEDDEKKIARSYHYRFWPSMMGTSAKSVSKFSTVDPILLKGNSGEVLEARGVDGTHNQKPKTRPHANTGNQLPSPSPKLHERNTHENENSTSSWHQSLPGASKPLEAQAVFVYFLTYPPL